MIALNRVLLYFYMKPQSICFNYALDDRSAIGGSQGSRAKRIFLRFKYQMNGLSARERASRAAQFFLSKLAAVGEPMFPVSFK